jgi:hypothetical protein
MAVFQETALVILCPQRDLNTVLPRGLLFVRVIEQVDRDRVAEEIDFSQFEATQLQTRSLLKIGHQIGMVLLPGILAFLSGPEMGEMKRLRFTGL